MQNRVGYLPEDRGLYKKMRVGEQLAFFATLKGVPKTEVEKRIDSWLARMSLSEWKNKKVGRTRKACSKKCSSSQPFCTTRI
ncbi:MAG: hypothetical protein U0Y68_04440 [Blastocatellia bacterium]